MIQKTIFWIAWLLIMTGCQPLKRPSILKKSTIQPDLNMGREDRKFSHMGKLFGDVAILSSQPDQIEDFGRQKTLWTATLQMLRGFSLETVDPDLGWIQTHWFCMPKIPNQRFKIVCRICRNPNWVKAISVVVKHQAVGSGQWKDHPNRDVLAFYIKDYILTLARKNYRYIPENRGNKNQSFLKIGSRG